MILHTRQLFIVTIPLLFIQVGSLSINAGLILFDSISPADQVSSTTIYPDIKIAQGFQTSLNSFIVDSIDLQLYKQSSGIGLFSVRIYDINPVDQMPYNQIADVAVDITQDILKDTPSIVRFENLAINLDSLVGYYIVVEDIKGTGLLWDYWDTINPIGIGLPSSMTAFSSGIWIKPPTYSFPQLMIVRSVPEPSSILAFTIGVILLIMNRRFLI